MKTTGLTFAIGLGLLASPVLTSPVMADTVPAAVATTQQADDDWDLVAQPDGQLTTASVDFGANLVAVRCRSGVLDVLMSGVPVSASVNRRLEISVGGIHDEKQVWTSTPGGTVVSPPNPDRIARQLRAGGELNVLVEATNTRGVPTPGVAPHRYRLPIPASAAAIDRVLTACNRPLNSARDAIAHSGVVNWRTPPRIVFPEQARRDRVEQGMVTLSCIVGAQNQPQDCEVVGAVPAGHGFEEAAIRATRNAQLDARRDPVEPGHAIEFHVVFRGVSDDAQRGHKGA